MRAPKNVSAFSPKTAAGTASGAHADSGAAIGTLVA
jgi:hypothetical protein